MKKKTVKLLTGMAGHDYSYQPGDVVEFELATAEGLVAHGFAQFVAEPEPAPKLLRKRK